MLALTRLLPTPFLRVAGLAILLAQPFVLEFMAVARGYALGLGFAALGTVALVRVALAGTVPRRQAWLVPLWFSLAVLSNLTFAPLWACALAWLVAANRPRRDALLAAGASLLALAAILGPPVVRMTTGGDLFAGGQRGLWADTIQSLAAATLAERWSGQRWLVATVATVATAIVAAALARVIARLLRRRTPCPWCRAVATLTLLIVGPLLAIVVLHAAFGVHYPVERMAIYLLPLVLACGLWCAAELPRRWVTPAVAFALAAVLVNLLAALDLTHHPSWRYDASTPALLSSLEQMTQGGARLKRPLRLGLHWQLEPSVNFYLHQRRIWWLEPVDRRGPDRPFDVYYLALPQDRQLIARRGLRVIEQFPVSGLVLAVPENRP